MSEFTSLATFLSGLGFGGIITFIIKHSLEQKSKIKEMWLLDYKATCDGLLNSYKEIALSGSRESLKEFAYYQIKLELYANDEVLFAAKKLQESASGSTERDEAIKILLKAMRTDLGMA